jgi:hypothetical protein
VIIREYDVEDLPQDSDGDAFGPPSPDQGYYPEPAEGAVPTAPDVAPGASQPGPPPHADEPAADPEPQPDATLD